jgi:hypothetical protein
MPFLIFLSFYLIAAKAKGKDDRYIQEYQFNIKTRKEMRPRIPYIGGVKQEGSPRIKWSCDEETFTKKMDDGEVSFDIAKYFLDIYDTVVQFPNMPIVCIGNEGTK